MKTVCISTQIKRFFFLSIFIVLFLGSNAVAVNTHIQTDSTLSGIAELNINTTGSGQLYTLSEINGKLAGNNLFYSFSNFSIGTGDSAWFSLNTPGLENVISRVTGGAESVIDGQLKMTNTGNAPSFFFINPAGVTFSSGASVDVPGSFYVSTASGLNFGDGSRWSVSETPTSSLSAANPDSFGFLGNETGNINIGDVNPTNITFKPGVAVVFSGNEIHVNNATIRNEAFSQAGLDLQFFATGNEAINVNSNVPAEKTTAGDLYITNSLLNPSGNGFGRILTNSRNLLSSNSDFVIANTSNLSMKEDNGINFHADSIELHQTNIFTFAMAEGNGPGINIFSNVLTASTNSLIRSATIGRGAASDIIITADIVNLINSSAIRSYTASQGMSGNILINTNFLEINKSNIINTTQGEGSTGNIDIMTNFLLMNDRGGIVLFTETDGSVGELTIDSKLIVIDNGGMIVSKTIGEGDAGDINISTDLLKMSFSGEMDPNFKTGIDAGTFSNGDGGNVTVNADRIEMTHGFIGTSTGGKDAEGNIIGGKGSAGAVSLIANSLELTDGAIVSNTLSQGAGGLVSIETNDLKMINSDITSDAVTEGNGGSVSILVNSMWVDNSRVSSTTVGKGNASQILIDANELKITNNSIIQSETFSDGKAGSISILGRSVYLDNRGIITSSSRELAEGHGGEVTINTKLLEINNGAILSVADSTGDAGNIIIQSDTLKLNNNGLITTSTLENASGNGGIVNIYANRLEVNDGHIATTTFGAGEAGNVFISGNSINLNSGSIESAAREGSSDRAGNIRIDFSESLLLNPFRITTESVNGNGGDITIQGEGIVFLLDSAITTSVSGETGDGGDIAISANGLILNSGFVQANTAAAGASGGDVNIKTPALIPSGNLLLVGGNNPFQFQPASGLNVIQAAAPDGVSGTINTTTPQLNLNAMLTNLTIESFDTNALNRDMCSVGEGSSLLQSGRGAQPLRARDLLLSPVF